MGAERDQDFLELELRLKRDNRFIVGGIDSCAAPSYLFNTIRCLGNPSFSNPPITNIVINRSTIKKNKFTYLNMLLNGEIYFAPKTPYSALKWEDPKSMVLAFKKRINGYYLKPAKRLAIDGDSFASTLLVVCAIDAIIRISKEKDRDYLQKIKDDKNDENRKNGCPEIRGDACYVRPSDWSTYLKELEIFQSIGMKFYHEIRSGLVHECRLRGDNVINNDKNGAGNSISEHNTFLVDPLSVIDDVTKFLNRFVAENSEGQEGIRFLEAINKLFEKDKMAYGSSVNNISSNLPLLVSTSKTAKT